MGRVKLLMTAFHSIAPLCLAEVFFCGWSKKYQFLPRPTGQREHGSECHTYRHNAQIGEYPTILTSKKRYYFDPLLTSLIEQAS